MSWFAWISLICLICLLVSGGWIANEWYYEFTAKRTINGFYAENVPDYNTLLDIQSAKERNGDWVCVNVNGMKFPDAYDTCVHECSHRAYSEIYAEKCEDDFEGCVEVMENG